MTPIYSFDDLKRDVADGRIDTIIAAQVDMQGRLMGKRFQAEYFVESAYQETHSCNYLLATDIEMETISGYKATSWEQGYGDYTMKPDLSTLRKLPWLEGTALVLCDVLDHHTHADVPHSPRAVLKRQVQRLADMGMSAFMATELEFFLFDQTYDQARESGYRNLKLASGYNEDYHIFQTTKEEEVMRAIRTGLQGAGIPVENSKGEASAGQEEINVRYADALTMADRHVIIKNACKEIAWGKGKAITFLAKWNYSAAGSSSHIHQSLWSADGKTPLFFDKDNEHGMSELMKHYIAGLLAHASEITYLPGALYQFLQALHGRHVRADQGRLVEGQPHRGLPSLRRGVQGNTHRMPRRRFRPEPLSRHGGTDCGGHRRDREEDDAGACLRRRRLWRQGCSRNPANAA
jgi:glutamine synthetase